MRFIWLASVLGLTLGSVSGVYGGTIAADWAEEMTLTPQQAGWGAHTGNIGTVGSPIYSKRVDGLMSLVQTGSGSWFHAKTAQGGQIAPRSDIDEFGNLINDGFPTHGSGPLGFGNPAGTGGQRGIHQYTVDLKFKITNYNWDLLVDGDQNSSLDSNGDGDPAYDPYTFDNNNPNLPEGPAVIGGDFSYGPVFNLIGMGRNGAHGLTSLGFQSHGFNLAGDPPAITSAKTSFTAGERYTGSFMSLTNNTGNDVRFGAEPGVNLPHIQGIDLSSDGGIQGTWRILRMQFTANNEAKVGAFPFDVYQGRMRYLIGDENGQNWINLGDVDVDANPNTNRDRSIYLETGTGNPNGDGTVGKADIEFDYMRISYAAIPDNVLIGAAGAGAGNIILSPGDVTRMEIAGDPVVNAASHKLYNGTDYDVIRTRRSNFGTQSGTLQGSVTLAGTVNFVGGTQEGPFGEAPTIMGMGNGTDDRATILPDIGQGPSRRNPDYDPEDPINFPEFIVVNPADHRGKKMTRKGVVKAASVSGSFSAVQYGGVAASVLAEKGLFVKAVGFTNRLDPDQKNLTAHSGVDFVLLNAKLGDADGDEIVSATDVFTTLSNLGAAVIGEDWNRGNFDGDNLVSASDVFTALSNLGGYTPTAVADISSVPEPSSALLLLSVLAMGGVARRRV